MCVCIIMQKNNIVCNIDFSFYAKAVICTYLSSTCFIPFIIIY